MITQGPESEIARLFREAIRLLKKVSSRNPDWENNKALRDASATLERIGLYFPPLQLTPTEIEFREVSMNPAAAGQTQVFTGTLSPEGSAFPAGTSFTVTSNDTRLTFSVDSSGTRVSISYPEDWSLGSEDELFVEYSSSSFEPVPMNAPSSVQGMIYPTRGSATPPPPVNETPTPTGISFAQTE